MRVYIYKYEIAIDSWCSAATSQLLDRLWMRVLKLSEQNSAKRIPSVKLFIRLFRIISQKMIDSEFRSFIPLYSQAAESFLFAQTHLNTISFAFCFSTHAFISIHQHTLSIYIGIIKHSKLSTLSFGSIFLNIFLIKQLEKEVIYK